MSEDHARPLGSEAASAPWGHAPWPGPQWQRAHDNALVLGVLAVCTGLLGLVLGPIALVQANRARTMGPDAGAARVTAWIGICLGALALLAVLLYVMLFAAMFAGMVEGISRLDSTAAVFLGG